MAIKLQAKEIPQNPGVYFFRKGGEILYIGKAANLRSRLRSYFSFGGATAKSSALIKEAAKLNWEVLGSEAEALIREAELIKKYRPKYNVLMRDDKNYFYAGFTKETFPRIFITHQKKGEANYIGAFTEGGVLRSVLKTLRKEFPYCTCMRSHKRLCLNAKIGRCLGFCCNAAASDSLSDVYKKNIYAIKQVLSGKNQSLTRSLKKEMKKLSNGQKYEEAGRVRDQINALNRVFEHKSVIRKDMPSENNRAIKELETLLKISEIRRIEAYDIANIHGKFAYGSMAVFVNGALQKNDYRIFKINEVTGSDDPKMIAEVIARRFKHPEWPYPQVIIVDGGKQQLNAGRSTLSNFSRLTLSTGAPTRIQNLKGFRSPRIIALTKNERHVGDHIFIERTKNPIPLSKLPESLKNLILLLDSEAHRFAIKFYRKSHRKNLFA